MAPGAGQAPLLPLTAPAHAQQQPVDTTAPRVTSIAFDMPDRVYYLGDSVRVTVGFGEPVEYSGEPPVLYLNVSGFARPAPYASGDGTAALTFAYELRAGDRADDLDYYGTAALSGSGIADLAGNAADLELPVPGAAGSLSHSSDVLVDALPWMIAKGSARDEQGGFRALDGASDADAIVVNGTAYAVVASTGGAVQLLRVHENGTLRAAYEARDGSDFEQLGWSTGVDAFYMDGAAYAIAAAHGDGGVQLMRIHGGNGTLSPVAHATNSPGSFDKLGGAHNAAVFALNGSMHAIVAGFWDDGVQLVRIHPNGDLSAPGSLADSGDLELEKGFSSKFDNFWIA